MHYNKKERDTISEQVRLKDIAKRANVSLSSVCRALQGKSNISQNTKDNIKQIAEELGYQPNAIARSLRLKKSNVLGVIIPDNSNPYFASLLKGIETTARNRKYTVIVINTGEECEIEIQAISTLISLHVAGIVAVPIDENNYENISIPHIFISRCRNNGTMQNSNYLINDDFYGAYIATAHLIEKGFEKIYYINGLRSLSISELRLKGYKKALSDAEIPFNDKYVLYGNLTMQDGYNSLCKIACIEQQPFGVFCFSDYVAIGVLHGIKEFGFKIPQEISIVGYDDIEIVSFMDLPLTTIGQAKFDFGELGADILFDIIEHPDKHEEKVHKLLKPVLIVRKTT